MRIAPDIKQLQHELMQSSRWAAGEEHTGHTADGDRGQPDMCPSLS